MPWQEAGPGTIAQDEQGTYHVKNGDQWVAAPKGSVAKDEAGKFHFNSDSLAPAPVVDTPAAPPERPGALTQIGHAASTLIAAPIAQGAGTLTGVAKNVGHMFTDAPYEDPRDTGKAWAAPFQYAEPPEQPGSEADLKQRRLQQLPSAADIPGVRPAMESPAGQFVGDVVKPAADIVGGAASLTGAGQIAKVAGRATGTAMEGISSAVGGANEAEAARIAANPQVVRARADGYKLTADDVRAKTNPADANKPNADLPGPGSTTPDVADRINVHNQARATQTMAQDVKLPNTRNINPDEVTERITQEAQTYGKVGDAIGSGKPPTPVLDHDISMAGAKNADPAVQAKVDKDVSFYRDELKGNFDGPKAVQTVRTLRNSAQELADSKVPGDQARAKTYQNIANAIEDEMMRQLPASAQELRTAFPASRQQMAKLYELGEVSEGGQVNPAKVLKLKQDGKPLSGAADAVANAAEVAPESMQGPRGSPTHITTAPQGRGFWINTWNLGKAALHKIPGLNPASDAYQASRYGPVGGSAATPPASAAPNVSEVRPPVQVTPPPGNAGNGRQTEMPLPPGQPAPPAFELTHPEGTAFEPTQHPLTNPRIPGQAMDSAEWDRQALARVRKMTPPERARAEGPAVPFDKLSTTEKSRRPKPLGRAFDRDRE